jgi:hypothetical protein
MSPAIQSHPQGGGRAASHVPQGGLPFTICGARPPGDMKYVGAANLDPASDQCSQDGPTFPCRVAPVRPSTGRSPRPSSRAVERRHRGRYRR